MSSDELAHDKDGEIIPQRVIQVLPAETMLLAVSHHSVMSISDKDGMLLFVNDNFAKNLKYNREELVGQHHSFLNSGVHPASYFKHIWKQISDGNNWRGKICNKAKDGSLVWTDTSITPVTGTDGNPYYVIVKTDITGLVDGHQREHIRAGNEKCLNALLATAFNASDLNAALEFAIDNLLTSKWLKIEKAGGIFLYDEDTKNLHLVAERNLSDQIKTKCSKIKSGYCLCGRAALTKEIQFASCIDDRHEVRFPGMKPHGHYNLPILFDGKLLGVLVVYLEHGIRRDETCEAFLREYAEIIGILIDTKRGAEALARKTQLLQAVIDNIDDGISFYNTDLRMELFNEQFLGLMDYPPNKFKLDDSIDKFFRFSTARGDYGPGEAKTLTSERFDRAKMFVPFRRDMTLSDGVILDIIEKPIPGLGMVTTYKDVTERANTANQLRESKQNLETRVRELEFLKTRLEEQSSEALRMAEQLQQVKDIQIDAINNISEGFVLWDSEDRLIMCNDVFQTFYPGMADVIQPGIRFEEFVRVASKRGVIDVPKEEKAREVAIAARVERHLNSREVFDQKLPDGRWVTIAERKASDGRIVGVITDISKQRATEEAIKRLAETDDLTGLPNRTLFYRRLHEALALAQRNNHDVGVMLLDVDDFKDINDTLGHPVGDALLREVARRLQKCARVSDTVARLGGDEFVIIATNMHDELDVEFLAERVVEAVAHPYELDGHVVHTSASIGITVFPQDHGDPDELLRNADIALYRAKENARGSYKLFDDRMNADVQTRRAVEADLRRAMGANELALYFQPQVEIPTGKIIGIESLIRWKHPDYGIVPPNKFIPVAESTRLIIPLGEWILKTACELNKQLQEMGIPCVDVAVNISPLQFKHKGFLEQLKNALDQSALDPQWLELEVTESMAMGEEVLQLFQELKDIGVKLAIDDFGTGFSSMSRLKTFPVDRLKIDQSFVRDIDTMSDHHAISTAIIQLGHNLNLKVIAEGVETIEEMESLVALGCDEAQGYLYAPALPFNELVDFLKIHDTRAPTVKRDLQPGLNKGTAA